LQDIAGIGDGWLVSYDYNARGKTPLPAQMKERLLADLAG
jgi:hypothetical protein